MKMQNLVSTLALIFITIWTTVNLAVLLERFLPDLAVLAGFIPITMTFARLLSLVFTGWGVVLHRSEPEPIPYLWVAALVLLILAMASSWVFLISLNVSVATNDDTSGFMDLWKTYSILNFVFVAAALGCIVYGQHLKSRS